MNNNGLAGLGSAGLLLINGQIDAIDWLQFMFSPDIKTDHNSISTLATADFDFNINNIEFSQGSFLNEGPGIYFFFDFEGFSKIDFQKGRKYLGPYRYNSLGFIQS